MMTNKSEKKMTAIALGAFDGMHRAHQTVATGAENVTIYCVNNRFTLLQKSIFEQRFPNAVFADFSEIRDLSGEAFIEDIILGRFNADIVLCGFNFCFGKSASWNALDLRHYLEEKDVWVRILEHQDFEDMPISSSRIRDALSKGNVKTVNAMLGYSFIFENEVVKGDKRGITIGYPTINQWYPSGLTVPKFGVYESRTIIDGKRYKSFTNLGVRPTWRVKKPLAETHIFDYSGNLYNQTVQVELIDYLREEKIFSSVYELKEQLYNDKSSII